MVCLFRRTHCAPVSGPLGSDLKPTIQYSDKEKHLTYSACSLTGSPYKTSYLVVSYFFSWIQNLLPGITPNLAAATER